MNATIALPNDKEAAKTAILVSQAAAIEQARAVAEVQAAVTVAQNRPRDENHADAQMTESCSSLTLADRAFYTVHNRGTGPSIHLARELARIWGNIDYGVRELRRDDAAGESEIQAFAWDQQTNTRTTRTFIQPHAKMAGGRRKAIVDLGEIYLSNQNTGARAVRECIFAVLPAPFTEKAQDLCRKTIEDGKGEPLESRIPKMVEAFDGIGISLARLEAKIGRPKDKWQATDVAQMRIAYSSITRDNADPNDEFPQTVIELASTETQN